MGGLAVAIGLAMLAMLIVPVVVLVLIAKRFGAVPMIAALVLGLVVGVLAISATFFEDSWSPPMRVVLEGQTNEAVIVVVADENAAPLVITGSDLPFMEKKTVIQVPPNGLVRVKSLEPLYGQNLNARRGDVGASGFGSMPEGMVFDFNTSPEWIDYSELIKKRLAQ